MLLDDKVVIVSGVGPGLGREIAMAAAREMWGPPVEAYVDMTASAQRVPPEQVIAGITANMPLGEIPTDGDVADAVMFFVSDRARMVTAQTLMISAGEFPH